MMKPKGKGAGIMVTDFIDEHHGFLAFSDEEREQVKLANPSTRKYAQKFLEYGESKEVYWNRDESMSRSSKLLKWQRSSTQKSMGGAMSGYSTTAAAMLRWLTTPWTSIR
jgi:hypothetical protein